MNVLLFATLLTFALCHTATRADYVFVSTAQQLVDLLSATSETPGRGMAVDIMLTENLDFAGLDFFPLGFFNDTCTPYSGVFDGKGHTIANLRMDKYAEPKNNGAALLCGLANATVRDLVFDASCHFCGRFGGALSLTANGTVHVDRVVSRAAITGYLRTGGLVGYAERTSNCTLTFTDCVNEGDITCANRNAGDVGGLIGRVMRLDRSRVTMVRCTNRGRVELEASAGGGLAGYVGLNTNTSVVIEDCANEGNVTGGYNQIGGLVGALEQNYDTLVAISGSANRAHIKGNERVGGLVGGQYDARNVTLAVAACTNSGHVEATRGAGGVLGGESRGTGNTLRLARATNRGEIQGGYNSYVAGLVGDIRFDGARALTVAIADCANYGAVHVRSGAACGLYYVDSAGDDASTIALGNSVNKGPVSGGYAYGFAPFAHTASNLVSLGALTGANEAHSFWPPNPHADALYGPRDACANCTEVIFFERNATSGLYHTADSHMRVDRLLNDGAKEHGYGMRWTSTLDLADETLEVRIGEPVGAAVLVAPGTRLDAIDALAPYPAPRYVLFDADRPESAYDRTSRVTADMGITIARRTKVIVRIPPTDARNADAAEVARTVGGLVPSCARMLVTTLVIGENRMVAQIDLFVHGEDNAYAIVDALHGLDRGKGCSAGILCTHTAAFVEGNEPSHGRRLAPPALLAALLVLAVAL